MRFLLVAVVALVGGGAIGWAAGKHTEEPDPTQADRIIEFCSNPSHRGFVLCGANSDDAVRDAVRDVIERQPPQIVEHNINVPQSDSTDSDDDTDSDTAPAKVIAPTPKPTQQPQPAPTTPPPVVKVPEVHAPELPGIGLPLLP